MRNFMFAFVFLSLAVCPSDSAEYFIEITPNAEQEFYRIEVGEVVTFEVHAYKNIDGAGEPVDIEGKIWWEYDKRLFDKLSASDSSITLKANAEGSMQLGATTLIKNNNLKRKIGISIVK